MWLYCFLSNDGYSVQFLNRFGKFIYSLSTISEMFFVVVVVVSYFKFDV